MILVRVFLCLSIFFLLSCQESKEPTDALSQQYDEVQAKIDELKREKIKLILERLAQKKLFSGVISIQQQGRLLLEESYGYEDFRAKKRHKLSSKSRFRIGAITQQFTATAIMLLEQEGKLKYEDSLSKFFSDISYSGITIRHLLTHTSGLPDYLSYFYTRHPNMFTYATNQNVLNWIINEKPALDFKSGDDWQFSNTNYVLLAEIIRKVAKKTFPDFLRLEIFRPLKMRLTTIPKPHKNLNIPNRVYGFNTDQKTLNDDSFLNKIYGDKGIYTCLEDLKIWNDAIDQNLLLKSENQVEAFNSVKLNNGNTYPYGFGWHLKPQENSYYNLGAWLGFQTAFIKLAKRNTCIIILSNNHTPVFQQIVSLVDNIMQEKPYKLPSEALSQ